MSPSEPRDEEPDDLVGLPAIAEEIGMNPSSVRKWVVTGRLPARKDGRKWLVSRAQVVELARSDEWQRPSAARERLLAAASATAPAPACPAEAWDDLPGQRSQPQPAGRARPEMTPEPAPPAWDELDLLPSKAAR